MGKIVLLLTAIGIPLISLIYAISKRSIAIFVLGILTFTVSQLFIRIPLIEWISINSSFYHLLRVTQPILFMSLLAISAGIFEEIARWIAMRYVLKERTVANGVIFGLGHGGIEAFILVGIPVVAVQTNVVANLDFYHSSLERICAIVIHVCLSLIVLKSVQTNKFYYVIIAISLHGILNFGVIVIASVSSQLATIIVLLILTIFILICVYLIHRGNKNEKVIH